MFYAASEITFWILLAAIIGGGIGYGLNEARSVRLGKRLTESRADAPLERELAIAWDTIEDLNKRLQVAHETIRKSTSGSTGVAPPIDFDEADDVFPAGGKPDTAAAPAAAMPVQVDRVPPKRPMVAAVPRPIDHAPEPDSDPEPVPVSQLIPPDVKFDSAATAQPAGVSVPDPAGEAADSADEGEGADGGDGHGVVGSRLSHRVASASIANQADITNTVDFD